VSQRTFTNHSLRPHLWFFNEPIHVSQRTFKKWFFKTPFLVPQRTFKTRVFSFKAPFLVLQRTYKGVSKNLSNMVL